MMRQLASVRADVQAWAGIGAIAAVHSSTTRPAAARLPQLHPKRQAVQTVRQAEPSFNSF